MSSNIRLISRLDIKGPNLIKGIHLEGLKKIGNPNEFATKYYNEGIDEILYMDIVASLYGRNNLQSIIRDTVKNIYVPITVGGGIKSIEDARDILKCGAEKIAINTAATKNPDLIKQISNRFGSQSIVVSIEAKKISDNKWEVYTENGREKTGMDVLEWAQKVDKLNAGEILLTSIDNEGTQKGFDNTLIKTVSNNVSIPVIASGGMGSIDHAKSVIEDAKADAIAMAHVLHYSKYSIRKIRSSLIADDVNVRKL
jgi:cyclase|tara:strand:- start:367 stop:1131 length:765 start_codon:yes stop_codon:yes gene_type:complete